MVERSARVGSKDIITNIVNYVNSTGRFNTTDKIIENTFWFYVSSLIQVVKPSIVYKNKLIDINYFGITIAPSGFGKSKVFNDFNNMFLDEISKWETFVEQNYDLLSNENEQINVDGFETELKNFLPPFYVSIEGTSEGLYTRALAISKACIGSLNVTHEEIMDIIVNSNINSLKELYDGRMLGKVIKSSVNQNIYGIRANMLIFGSSIQLKRDARTYEYFNKSLGSGIYRRSFIYYEEPRSIELRKNEVLFNSEVIDTMKYNLNNFIKNSIKDAIKYCEFPKIELSSDAYEYSELINIELLEFANKYIDDERFSAELGSFEKIIKLSSLMAILRGKNIIEYEDIEYAYSFYKELRSTNERLFNVEPQHKRIYKIIKTYGQLTKSELLEKDILNRSTLNEDMLLLEEYAYRQNERVVITGSKIKKYSIEPLPSNNLKKIIVSLPEEDKGPKTQKYISYEIPFFGEKKSIEKLVTSKYISNFTLVHFKDGKRSASNIIEGQNCIALDIDDSLDLNEMRDILKYYTYIIYTTKSHRKEKNGFIADRYRVLLPTKNKFYVDNDRHKQLILNICDSLSITAIDHNALDGARLWFTNPDGEVFKNQGELFDVIPFLPDTKTNEVTSNQLKKFVEEDDNDDSVKRRINGMIKWVLSTTYKGNRNTNLFKLGVFVLDLTNDINEAINAVYSVNNMLEEPVDEKEIESTIVKSLKRRA